MDQCHEGRTRNDWIGSERLYSTPETALRQQGHPQEDLIRKGNRVHRRRDAAIPEGLARNTQAMLRTLYGRKLKDTFKFMSCQDKYTDDAVRPKWRRAWALKELVNTSKQSRQTEWRARYSRCQWAPGCSYKIRTVPSGAWDRTGTVVEKLPRRIPGGRKWQVVKNHPVARRINFDNALGHQQPRAGEDAAPRPVACQHTPRDKPPDFREERAKHVEQGKHVNATRPWKNPQQTMPSTGGLVEHNDNTEDPQRYVEL